VLVARDSRAPSTWTTHAALVVVQVAFASQAVEAKLAMLPRAEGGEEIFPEALAMARMIGGAIFFQVTLFFRAETRALDTSRNVGLSGKMHAKLALLAALGIAINQALFLAGLRVSTPFVVSLLGATIPVFTAALAVVFRKERASWRTGAGLVFALSGVLWLTGVGSLAAHSGDADKGAIIVSLNCLSYSAYVVFSRDVVKAIGAFRLMAWVFTYGALLFAPLGIPSLALAIPSLTSRGLVLLAYIIVVPTIVAYGLNAWALGRSTATMVTIYIYMQPLLAGVLARIQLGTSISSRAGVATVLILMGVAVTTWRGRRRAT
jgi:drug/metabolite transporter (DMT)-like permease